MTAILTFIFGAWFTLGLVMFAVGCGASSGPHLWFGAGIIGSWMALTVRDVLVEELEE